jgi:hypothetical protein
MTIATVQRAMPSYCRVVLYDRLPKTLAALFGNKKCVILFYQMHNRAGKVSDRVGHFSLLTKTQTGIRFFSSYGMRPEAEIHKSHSKNRLLKLLGKNYTWSRRQYQAVRRVQTCALHCIARAYFSDLSDLKYSKLMTRFMAKNADDLVSIMTLCLVNRELNQS